MRPMSNRFLTPYQRPFWARLLQRRAVGGLLEALAGTQVDAQVNPNPAKSKRVDEQTLLAVEWKLACCTRRSAKASRWLSAC